MMWLNFLVYEGVDELHNFGLHEEDYLEKAHEIY